MRSLDIRVSAQGRLGTFAAGIKIDEVLLEAYKPLAFCDDPLLCSGTGEIPKNSAMEIKAIKLREDAAERIAKALTEILIDAMKEKDTYNGYEKV